MSVKVKLCYGCNQLSSFDYTCIECEYVRDFCNNCNTLEMYFSMDKNQNIVCKECSEEKNFFLDYEPSEPSENGSIKSFTLKRKYSEIESEFMDVDPIICEQCEKYMELVDHNFHDEATILGECGSCEIY